jgi:hypothetical protein
MASLCRQFGISRKTGHKIFERYQPPGRSFFAACLCGDQPPERCSSNEGTATSSSKSPAIPSSACLTDKIDWIPIFLATLAVRQQNQTVRFKSSHDSRNVRHVEGR